MKIVGLWLPIVASIGYVIAWSVKRERPSWTAMISFAVLSGVSATRLWLGNPAPDDAQLLKTGLALCVVVVLFVPLRRWFGPEAHREASSTTTK